MKQSTGITIIIPTKNERKNLGRLLKSILQKRLPREVIVVDNHSTDGTIQVAKRMWNDATKKGGYKFSPRTQARLSAWLVSQKRKKSETPDRRGKEYIVTDLPQLTLLSKGPERSAQRNAGARIAKGSHLLFLDADMEMTPTLLPELQLLAKKGVKAANLKELAVGHDFWGKAIALERNCYWGDPILEAPRFIEAKLFRHLGGYDSSLIAGEDWDLAERLNQNGTPVVYAKSPLLHHEAMGFLPNIRRKWYYTHHIRRYARKNPGRFLKQSAPRMRLNRYWENRRMLLRYPLYTLAFLLMKVLIYGRFRLSNK
ncbi:MAG: hypothetical protein A2900_05840 [Candidatus Chisholmbacteria bacterium RIFCSPLOWO2_01_FULL_50_28]|uniref:Glycosyltransferase 2-like domain-containing protein n=1 Tax=Candidatus Chisholmbacteria bacterium RIFCSPHIGHO2_01_FULL_52_32 TaxID=1797591 RepID=A0A1G1VQI1_9BACT|nr:MAG: hypothetical protein A2786_05615 [Candidatus Chisholmbacteria bacterium RIFCSPHIGHO2_01_FULL_52_32]OGY20558.1 MAG: hypothetical protein A2900_05840 [Candidatus Chisholmbacteria bacterium RIFCSPLOWO2_01_FULL_50_28]